MNSSAKERFHTHYKILRKHFGIEHLPYDLKLSKLTKEEYVNKLRNDSYYGNISHIENSLTDEVFETLKSLSIFFDQRDKMTCKEFNKVLIEEYGDALNIERDIREIEKSKVLSNIDRNIKTIRGIIVFFFVLWIIASVISILF
jgi:uncharacterized protein YfeS